MKLLSRRGFKRKRMPGDRQKLRRREGKKLPSSLQWTISQVQFITSTARLEKERSCIIIKVTEMMKCMTAVKTKELEMDKKKMVQNRKMEESLC